MHALTDRREPEETASPGDRSDRWLAVSEPLPVDDDPDWEETLLDLWLHEPAA